jgi:hypothetical protein
MVSEPQLDNSLYTPYNITKTFATNHKAGNTVLTSSSSDTDIKVVVSNDSTKQYITLTNTNSGTKSGITITGIKSGTNSLIDNATGQYYAVTLGIASIPNIDGYEVQTLQTSGVVPLSIFNTPSGNLIIQGHTAQINSTIDIAQGNRLDTVQTNLSGVLTNKFNLKRIIRAFRLQNSNPSERSDNSIFYFSLIIDDLTSLR